jgi:hypothetical protein
MPVAAAVAIRRTGGYPLDAFPFWCVAVLLGLVLFAPAARIGGPTEYQHRPFVLAYAAAFVWTVMWVDRGLRSIRVSAPSRQSHLIGPVLLVVLIGAAAASGWRRDPARPQFEWGDRFFGKQLDPGLLETAAFVRSQAVAGDIFALIPADPSTELDDAATRFAALSDVPAYVARAGVQVMNGPARRAVVEERLSMLNHVEATDDLQAAFLTLRRAGVTLLVALGGTGPRFDPGASRATFRTAGAAVYRIE